MLFFEKTITRLTGASDQRLTGAMNLFVDVMARSIGYVFPNFLGADSSSGAEW